MLISDHGIAPVLLGIPFIGGWPTQNPSRHSYSGFPIHTRSLRMSGVEGARDYDTLMPSHLKAGGPPTFPFWVPHSYALLRMGGVEGDGSYDKTCRAI